MNDAKHTPSPWVVYDDDSSDSLSITSEARMDAFMGEIAIIPIGYSEPFEGEQQANAAFIVRACNAHDELVSIVRDLVEYGGSMDGVTFHALTERGEALLAKVSP